MTDDDELTAAYMGGYYDAKKLYEDEIERLREENTYLQQIIKEYQRAMGFDEECSIALGEKD